MKQDNIQRRRAWSGAVIAFAVFALPSAALAETVPADLSQQITTISSDVAQKRKALIDLNAKTEKYRSLIQSKHAESATLEDQIALAEDNLATLALSIQIAQDEIRQLGLEIRAVDAKMKDQAAKMAEDRRLLGGLARKLYRAKFNRSTFEILASHDSFSSFFDDIHEIITLEGGVHKTLKDVQTLQTALGEERRSQQAKQDAVAARERDLEVAKADLEDARTLKQVLLEQTQQSELDYRYRLGELKREQNDADSEITYLERVLRQKLDIADRIKSDGSVLTWPVTPMRGIATRFHDPGYPFRYIFEHPGLDIRAYQGTPVRAAGPGIVARAKNAGMGYSYVMLIHNNNVSTVYGHLSKITIKEDTFVERGEIIGYSGGMPGTPGAGSMTTGPHLHFETRVGGIPVDPMKYLASL